MIMYCFPWRQMQVVIFIPSYLTEAKKINKKEKMRRKEKSEKEGKAPGAAVQNTEWNPWEVRKIQLLNVHASLDD